MTLPRWAFDSTNSQHIPFLWWTALPEDMNNQEARGALQRLTWSLRAFGDYERVNEALAMWSIDKQIPTTRDVLGSLRLFRHCFGRIKSNTRNRIAWFVGVNAVDW